MEKIGQILNCQTWNTGFKWVDLKSDGKYLQVEYDKNKHHCHCENPMEVVWYETSGSMQIILGALLIPEDANIKYVRNLVVEEKPVINKYVPPDEQQMAPLPPLPPQTLSSVLLPQGFPLPKDSYQ